MPTIRVNDRVFEHLKRHAEPIVDSANDVLERVFAACPICSAPTSTASSHASERHDVRTERSNRRSQQGRRLPGGQLLAHSAYELPILTAVNERGGSAPAAEVIKRVGAILDNQLREVDRSLNNSGGVRWINRTQWMRQRLVERGYLAADSPRGIWAITRSGEVRMRELMKKVS